MRHPRGVPVRSALPIGRRDARAFSVRGHVSMLGRPTSLRPSTSLITGAVRKQPPGCFVLSKALRDRELFLPFFFHRRKAIGVAPSKTLGGHCNARPRRHKKKNCRSRPVPPPIETTDTRTQWPTHMHTRAIVHSRILRAFVTFYYWQSARYNHAYSPDKASQRQRADAPNSDTPS